MSSVNSSTSDPFASCTSPSDTVRKGVLIMDACPVTAMGIKRVLTQSCGLTAPVNYVQNLAGISQYIDSMLPKLLIMDLCGEKELMLDGLRLLAHLHGSHPLMKIIVCTDFSDHRVLELLVSSKVSGILLKQEPVLALAQCVTNALSGKPQWLSPRAKLLLSKATPAYPSLTARELDVLACLFSGQSVSRVAQTMHRNIRTVSTHKRNAMVKLGFHNDSELFAQGTWMAKVGPVVCH